jgi:uncharacterized protein YjiS (DUF1127 family)
MDQSKIIRFTNQSRSGRRIKHSDEKGIVHHESRRITAMSVAEFHTRSTTARASRGPGFLGWISLARAARRQRRALAELPPERLRDLGISAEAAQREAEKPIWNVPAHWLR